MRATEIEYGLNCGELGTHTVRVVGRGDRDMTGKAIAVVDQVWLTFALKVELETLETLMSQPVNVRSQLKSETIKSLESRLVAQYIADRYRGLEGAV